MVARKNVLKNKDILVVQGFLEQDNDQLVNTKITTTWQVVCIFTTINLPETLHGIIL